MQAAEPRASRTRLEVDVAAQLALLVAVDADVDDDASGLDHVGGAACRAAGRGRTTMSACRVWWREVGVPLWQTVTVAWACSSSSAMGLPTVLLRPITTAWLARRWAGPVLSMQLHAAQGRGRPQARQAGEQLPGAVHREAVDVLGRCRWPRSPACGVERAAGSGICTRMPWMARHRRSSARTRASSSAWPVVAG
jgi:hypothetical protein